MGNVNSLAILKQAEDVKRYRSWRQTPSTGELAALQRASVPRVPSHHFLCSIEKVSVSLAAWQGVARYKDGSGCHSTQRNRSWREVIGRPSAFLSSVLRHLSTSCLLQLRL